jgi:hypothetical protein
MAEHRIIAVTPAGRRAYLEILASYVLKDSTIEEWHLWDNCRREDDRVYINDLAKRHTKIKVVRLDKVDGSNGTINQFYQLASDVDTFYIKMDDDLVYLPENFGARLHDAALREKGQHIYWSPLVVNNAICSWLLKYHSRLNISAKLTASAACVHGWRSPEFALALHRAFLASLEAGSSGDFAVANFDISLTRFSINCIGFWGEDVKANGANFCPIGVDDEEWISAVLPSTLGTTGRIVGDLAVAHFAFYTQEYYLLKTDLLDRYFALAGVAPVPLPPAGNRAFRQKVRRVLERLLFSGDRDYRIVPASHSDRKA